MADADLVRVPHDEQVFIDTSRLTDLQRLGVDKLMKIFTMSSLTANTQAEIANDRVRSALYGMRLQVADHVTKYGELVGVPEAIRSMPAQTTQRRDLTIRVTDQVEAFQQEKPTTLSNIASRLIMNHALKQLGITFTEGQLEKLPRIGQVKDQNMDAYCSESSDGMVTAHNLVTNVIGMKIDSYEFPTSNDKDLPQTRIASNLPLRSLSLSIGNDNVTAGFTGARNP
jgi:hypothetical protein